MAQRPLDNVNTRNLSGVFQDLVAVVPNDSPPAADEIGNCPAGTFAIYNNSKQDGYIRVITRGGIKVATTPVRHPVNLLLDGDAHPVQLQIGGQLVPVVWQSGNPQTVRVWVPTGRYVVGRVVHVLAHDTTVGSILALVT